MKKIKKHFVKGAPSLAALMLGVLMAFSILVVAVPKAAFAIGLPTSNYCSSAPDRLFSGTGKSDDAIKFVACTLEQAVIPFLFAAATLTFIWGMVKFIGTQETTEREKGKQFMLWGVIALAVMFSVLGLVSILGNTFHVNNVVPQLPVN